MWQENVTLGWQAAQVSLSWSRGLREQEDWLGEGKLICMVQQSEEGGEVAKT